MRRRLGTLAMVSVPMLTALACSLQVPSEDELFDPKSGQGGAKNAGGSSGADAGQVSGGAGSSAGGTAGAEDAALGPGGMEAGLDGGEDASWMMGSGGAEAGGGAGGLAQEGGVGGSLLEAGIQADGSVVFDPDDGLVLHYTFNESSGELAHDSVSDGDGIVIGAHEWVSAGRVGRALRLPGGFPEEDGGTGSYVELPQGVLLGFDACSIATWFNWDAARPWERVFDFGNDIPVWVYFTPRGATGLPALAGRRPDPQGIFVDSTSIAGAPAGQGLLEIDELVLAGTWTHLAVTWDAERIRVYFNGEPVGEAVPVGDVQPKHLGNTTRNWIGRSQFIPGNATGFVDPHYGGMVDDFRIYDRALSASEVSQLHSMN